MLANNATASFARNALSNYAGKFVALASGLILTPLILQHIGPTGYGLWVLVGSVAAYGTLLDLGISNAIIKYVAEYRATGELDKARRLIATALTSYSILGVLIAAISAVASPYVSSMLQVPPGEKDTVARLTLVTGVAVGISLPCSTTPAILRGLQRFDLLNTIVVSSVLLSTVASVLVLLAGGGVVELTIVNLIVILLMQWPTVWVIRRVAPGLTIGWRGATRDQAARVFQYSSWVFAIDLAIQLQTKTDEIVIGAFLPIASIAPYALANRLAEVPRALTDQFLKLLLPLASERHVTHDRLHMRFLYLTSTRLTLAAALCIGTTLAFVAVPLLTLWVGPEYASGAPIVYVLVLASIVSLSQWPAFSIAQAIVRHRPLAISSIVSAVANLVLSIVLLQSLGVLGVALGTLVPTVLECLGFVLPYTARLLGATVTEIFREVILPTGLPALIMICLTLPLLAGLQGAPPLIEVLLVTTMAVSAYAGTYVLIAAPAFERRRYSSLARNAVVLTWRRLAASPDD